MKTWKRREQQVARVFGAERAPLSGSNGAITSSDSLHEKLYIETKSRMRHSAVSLWIETKEKAAKENKIPVVALAEKSRRGFWIVAHSDDLYDILQKLKEKGVYNE